MCNSASRQALTTSAPTQTLFRQSQHGGNCPVAFVAFNSTLLQREEIHPTARHVYLDTRDCCLPTCVSLVSLSGTWDPVEDLPRPS